MIGTTLLRLFSDATGCGGSSTVIDTSCLPHNPASSSVIDTILSVVFGIAASVALLVIVIGGFRYIVAHGDPQAVSQARKAILYAIIGLVVSMAAFSIVTFVVRGVGS